MAEDAWWIAGAFGRFLVRLVHAHDERAQAFYHRIGSKEWPAGLACICEGAAFDALADDARPLT